MTELQGIITQFPEDGNEQWGVQAKPSAAIAHLATRIWLDYCIRRGYPFTEVSGPELDAPGYALGSGAPTFKLELMDGTPVDLMAPLSSLGDEPWTRVRFVVHPREAAPTSVTEPEVIC